MNKTRLTASILMGIAGLILMHTIQAANPIWTLTTVPGYPPSASISISETATIKYIITNQSHKSHALRIKPIEGITPSGCTSPLEYHQSCTLTLAVSGSNLKGDVDGGPMVCDQSNSTQCYQPSQTNSLAIRLVRAPPVQNYTVTSSAGSNGSISPMGAQIVSPGSTLTFTATPNTGYGVNQWLVDGTLAQTGGTSYQLTNISANRSVNVTFVRGTLTPSVSTLALSVNCPITSSCIPNNDALTGTSRTITITNSGSVDVTNVLVSSVGLPSDASVSPSSCGTITAGGGTCVITVSPGAIASSSAGGTPCTQGVQPEGSVNITADGGLSTVVNTYVLSYGCIYQGGFIYSVDDTTSSGSSIGGKTAAITDTYPGQTSPPGTTPDWGADGIDIGSALYNTNLQGANDGSANSTAIISALTPGTPVSDYAAGLCSLVSVDASGVACGPPKTCYTNWYLPALCELGAGSSYCISGSTNIQQQLFESTLIPSSTLGIVNTGYYWSSTEDSNTPLYFAWMQYFGSGGTTSAQFNNPKFYNLGVRCSRALVF